jgi:SAM-dependent methyltransferase
MSIGPESTRDLKYNISEIDREIGAINGDYMDLDIDLIQLAVNKARTKGRVALLDAGCGIGLGLIDLKDQISFRAPLAENLIDAWGVSLLDYRNEVDQTDVGWRVKQKLHNDYIQYQIGNLATIPLPHGHFDVAYSSQVMLHNSEIHPIINNILPRLKGGGSYYFDTLVEQGDEVKELTDSLPENEWQTLVQKRTRSFLFGGEQSRLIHKITRED